MNGVPIDESDILYIKRINFKDTIFEAHINSDGDLAIPFPVILQSGILVQYKYITIPKELILEIVNNANKEKENE